MKHTLRAALVAGALFIGLAAPALPASAATGSATTATAVASFDPTESKAVQWLMDNIALTELNLSPTQKSFVNKILKLAMPIMCPIVAKAAAPNFQAFVEKSCLDIGKAADPWAALQKFTPLLCKWGAFVFPDYKTLLKTACGFLM